VAINDFLPLLSDIFPTMGIKTDREMENPAKMAPTQKPLAPICSLCAYRGRMGRIMLSPSIAVKIERNKTEKILILDTLSNVSKTPFWNSDCGFLF
jgi:hypothetical protein